MDTFTLSAAAEQPRLPRKRALLFHISFPYFPHNLFTVREVKMQVSTACD
jgi:hypothetical protein